MKNTITNEVADKKIIEYLTDAGAHGGYCLDGVKIKPGTAVTCLKAIAIATKLSYYRVKKCIGRLLQSGHISLVRYKCFSMITFSPAFAVPKQKEKPLVLISYSQDEVASPTLSDSTPSTTAQGSAVSSEPMPQVPSELNWTERRRLERQQAKGTVLRAWKFCE